MEMGKKEEEKRALSPLLFFSSFLFFSVDGAKKQTEMKNRDVIIHLISFTLSLCSSSKL